MSAQAPPAPKPVPSFDLQKALNRALGGGLSGAAAMVVQVATLMPLRTTMNYQYRFGTNTTDALKILYQDGGIRRFYRGIAPALLQGPLSRFGDTAANAGALAFFESSDITRDWPVAVKTIGASFAAASFRIVLTPIDTVKTTLQTTGARGLQVLKERMRVNGPQTLFYGAGASCAATFVGHYPWFFVYNYLNATLQQQTELPKKLLRSAVIGFSASVVSDTVSNSLRVIKTYRQTNEVKVSYPAAVRAIVAKDGLAGLFGRGLKTRIMTNGLQGLMFSVLWRLFEDRYHGISK